MQMGPKLAPDGVFAPCPIWCADETLWMIDGKERPLSIGTSPASADAKNVEVSLQVDVRGRWEALALLHLLHPFHSFLVQHTNEHWVVHARAPGWQGESVSQALRTIDDWRLRRGIDAAVRIDEPPMDPR